MIIGPSYNFLVKSHKGILSLAVQKSHVDLKDPQQAISNIFAYSRRPTCCPGHLSRSTESFDIVTQESIDLKLR